MAAVGLSACSEMVEAGGLGVLSLIIYPPAVSAGCRLPSGFVIYHPHDSGRTSCARVRSSLLGRKRIHGLQLCDHSAGSENLLDPLRSRRAHFNLSVAIGDQIADGRGREPRVG